MPRTSQVKFLYSEAAMPIAIYLIYSEHCHSEALAYSYSAEARVTKLQSLELSGQCSLFLHVGVKLLMQLLRLIGWGGFLMLLIQRTS